MNQLELIAAHKRREVQARKEQVTLAHLEKRLINARATVSLRKSLQEKHSKGIIAEIKRKSPSRGDMNLDISVPDLAKAYQDGGAQAVSILTDKEFFGGENADLEAARPRVDIPILRKEFILDTYQIYEARAIGADLILLIAAILSPSQIREFGRLAQTLGLEVLLEVHDLDELNRSICPEIDLLGVNNRNLKDFSVSLETSLNLVNLIPDQFVKVAESGIHTAADIAMLRAAGYQGFLIGQRFMETSDPGRACREFIQSL